ncbi:pilus assembly protein PilY [Acinetobacter sp. VNH17]|uniref:Pilus assembly protein PilY n=1 Tax=Acinetobacter thutiue TaxID=2998078 RepID=A0ABT7WPK0_9GAMM|nr:pilus assembly protein PilY [Acinetobacter thutiue]MCY6412390.1 pilus assembly protein PilY [Acinetobacter thutiue]MDN0014494.1 pilus assembly protein PilY [Acinetobacter thutiue]
MKNFNQKLLSASVSMLMTVSICHVATTQASDIEIYKLPDQTKLSIFMMLDLSGSMDRSNPNSGRVGSCDTPDSVKDGDIIDFLGVYDADGRGYTRNYCQVGGTNTKTYYYFKSGTQWYSCGASGTSSDPNTTRCPTKISAPSSETLSAYKSESSNTKYYAYTGGTKYLDRMSRLKDALYNLATSEDIPANTQIGIGTFVPNDGKRGYVVIKSDTWGTVGSAQRQKVLDLIKSSDFKGLNNTPTATSYAESAAYLLGTTTGGGTYSGIGLTGAASGITTGSGTAMKYISPLDKITEPLCSGKGIYFLTDGEPNGVGGSAKTPMKLALNLSSDISTSGGLVNTSAKYSSTADWEYIGAFAKYLNNGSNLQQFFSSVKNNNQHVIKTAVVGFGSVFDIPEDGIKRKRMTDPKTGKERTYYDCSKLTGRDQQNACNWGMKSKFSNGTTTIAGSGGYGEGGFYSAQNTDEVVTSFVNFVDDMKPEFEPIATGSPTSPVDALNPIQLQPYGYYASFTPKPQENYQLWLGNLNKYHVYKGELYNSSKTIKLIQSSGELNSGAYGIWGTNGGGVLEKLPLGTWTNPANATQKSSNRKVFTNREINTSNQAIEATSLQSVNLTTLFASGTDGKLVNDPKKNYWLNILGYKVAENATGLTINTLPTEEQRQLGAVMHSKPILLTQEGKIVVTKDTSTPPKPVVTTTARQDYLLFGTNQGMLHVVKVGTDTDTDRGEEVFTFVPHEMMEKQYKGFLSEGNTNLGRDNLYYGIDGAWTAYSQYVSKTGSASTLTVKGKNDDGDDLSNQAGLQLVYGGLRMGGRGYYGLDLRTITSPTLKFHINPDAAAANTPLSYMGQSWSKPTIAWVNWGGARKLVMFVGGGYDAGGVNGNGLDASGNRVTNGGYENPAYEQTNKKGAGVYMFDANDGSLLWWSSANVGTSTSATTDSGTIATNDDNLKYSVVSQINAVDRDGDGLVDHLYFGDLGGQAFRIDLNNKASTLGAFAKRVVRLYNAHVTTGASPRFYEMPSFSVHTGVDGYFGAVALSSGNRSSPLAGTNTVDGSVVTTITANDGVYVIYDNDVARKDLYDDITLRTSPTGTGVTLTDASAFATLKAGIAQKTGTNYNGGWKYQFHTTAGKYKGMNELYALDNMLYVNVYHKDGTGISGDCGSGVKGDTELYQFCLPTGKCPFEYPTTATGPNKIVLGGGILGTGLGVGYSNKLDEMSIIKGKEGSDCTDTANKNKPECQLFDTGSRLQHLRWYESR